MEWVEIANVIKELGISIVAMSAVIYLLVKYFSMLIENKKASKKIVLEDKEVEAIQYDSVKSLKKIHPYFNKIDGIIDTKLPIISIGGPVRTEIFRNVLNIYFKTAQDNINTLLEKNITLDNFLTENYKTANEIIKKSNSNMKEEGVPEVVIKKFNQWNQDRADYILTAISDIDSSNVFKTVIEKQYTVLSTYVNTSYFVLIDAERTLQSLNGDLTGTIYKGKQVEGLHE